MSRANNNTPSESKKPPKTTSELQQLGQLLDKFFAEMQI